LKDPPVVATVRTSVAAFRLADSMLDWAMFARSISLVVDTAELVPTPRPEIVPAKPPSWLPEMEELLRSRVVPTVALSKVTLAPEVTAPSIFSVASLPTSSPVALAAIPFWMSNVWRGPVPVASTTPAPESVPVIVP
jgi:hypothetical protein